MRRRDEMRKFCPVKGSWGCMRSRCMGLLVTNAGSVRLRNKDNGVYGYCSLLNRKIFYWEVFR